MDYPEGLDPYTARQNLLHHSFSPLISVQSSYNADVMVQTVLKDENTSILLILKAYGNNAKYHVPNQIFRITNTQLITKSYPSFPVRFEPSLPELLSVINASWSTTTGPGNGGARSGGKMPQLFSISSLEILLKHMASCKTHQYDLYVNFFNKIITSNKIVPFETFNHPISQVFVIDFHTETIESLRKSIVEFRNFNFPKYFLIDDLLMHVFILHDPQKTSDSELLSFQNEIKAQLNIQTTCIPIEGLPSGVNEEEFVKLFKNENSTIEEDLQRISLQQTSKIQTIEKDFLNIPKKIDLVIRTKVYEYINRFLIPHMEKKIRIWDDQILAPKKSIAGRFFSVSKKLFNNNDSPSNLNSNSFSESSFNYNENYYHKHSAEQKIRKLADWSLILKDFKYAYSTYELIRKDYTNDKAWVYVASTQEMCIVSLLLTQTQQINQTTTRPDRNTLRKIRHDIIEPYLDNLSYTFKSRLNLRSYNIKTLLVIIELLLCMCSTFNISWWWNDLIEKYLCKCINEFDSHLVGNNQKLQVIRALLYERLGYHFGKCILLNDQNKGLIDMAKLETSKEIHEDTENQSNEKDNAREKEGKESNKEEGYYVNPNKLSVNKNNSIVGLTRFRKSSIWYLLSIKEWLILENYNQIEYLIQNIRYNYNLNDFTNEWYDRNDLLLSYVKNCLKEHNLNDTQDP